MMNSAGKGERRKVHPPFAQPDPARRATAAESAAAEPPEAELPPIEQFIDELPPIEDFLLSTSAPIPDWSETSLYRQSTPPEPPRPAPISARATPPGPPETDSEGWAAGEWQSYDWGGLVSLGAPAPEAVEAHAAWSSTNWESTSQRLTDLADRSGSLPAAEVAAALDEMARRIRSGELSLERFQGTPPEAAIAAVFAALLRSRG